MLRHLLSACAGASSSGQALAPACLAGLQQAAGVAHLAACATAQQPQTGVCGARPPPQQQHAHQQQRQRWHSPQQQRQQQWRGMAASAPERHSTTILCIRRGSEVVIMGDGQATQGDFIVKHNVKKVRIISGGPSSSSSSSSSSGGGSGGSARSSSSAAAVVGGFAGVGVDGLALLERLEAKLEEHPGQLGRAAVELAKMWRQDKLLRELDASLVVADATTTLWLMGNGDVLEAPPADGVMGIGSGADFAESAARALLQLQRDVREGRVAPGGAASGGGGAAEEAQAAGRGQLAAVADMSLLDIARTAMRIAADSCVYTNTHFSWHHILPDGSIESGGSAASS